MIRSVIAAAGLLSAAASGAASDQVRKPVGMTATSGRCTSLVIGGKETPCGDAIISLRYSDGRRSFAVKAGDGLVSFLGLPDKDGLALDMVTGVRSGDGPEKVAVASQQVSGHCTPAMIAAKVAVSCTATAKDGSRYAMSFVTDETPPTDSDFTK